MWYSYKEIYKYILNSPQVPNTKVMYLTKLQSAEYKYVRMYDYVHIFSQKTLQEKLETAYLANQEKTKEYEQKLDSMTLKNSQVIGPLFLYCM